MTLSPLGCLGDHVVLLEWNVRFWDSIVYFEISLPVPVAQIQCVLLQRRLRSESVNFKFYLIV